MSDDDIDFELVTNANQLAPPPPLTRERVVLPDWKTTSGKAVGFLAWELTALEWGEFQETSRVYRNGDFAGISLVNEDLRYLSFTLRDANGNRLWSTPEAAVAQLGCYGKASITLLVAASNRVNSKNADQASAEGNSEPTPTGS